MTSVAEKVPVPAGGALTVGVTSVPTLGSGMV